jgi:multiple sugar transport system substrate-binding protein
MNRIFPRTVLLLLILTVFVSGCIPRATSEPLDAPPSATPTPTVFSPTPAPPNLPRVLRLWVPPWLNPANTLAGQLLETRLNTFAAAYPDLRVDLRVKAETGTASLYESLRTANAAAPETAPHLIALRHITLENAANNNLIYSYDGLTPILEINDWFPYAQQAARLQNSIFGIPFSGNALALVRRPETPTLAVRWDSIRANDIALLFPASDPQATFPLAVYLSMGGTLTTESGQALPDREALLRTLTLFESLHKENLILPESLSLRTDAQVWQSFREGRADLAITWASNYLREAPADTRLLALPGQASSPYTLGSAWTWALATDDPSMQPLAVALVEFLSDPAFLQSLNEAGGRLPPRISAVPAWQTNVASLSQSAALLPGNAQAELLGGMINKAVLAVLNGSTPEAALIQAMESPAP